VLLLVTNRGLLRVPRTAWPQLLVLGVFGVGIFYVALASGVQLAGIALLAVLGYLAPIWVTIIGALFLNEPFTPIKVAALMTSLVGAAFAVRVYDWSALMVSLPGILVGLLVSFGYAAFIIFSKTLSYQCDPRTILLYGFGIGAIVLLPFQSSELFRALQPGAWPLVVAVIAGPTLGAWTLFSLALRWIPAGNAAIVTSLDVVFTNVLAFLIYRELLEPLQLVGGALVVAAVVLLQFETPKLNPQPAPQPAIQKPL
jgi:drug/metabolite transporter (DMT)-like permease